MKVQEIFDIAYSVNLAGLDNEYQLVRTFFMRSGVRLSYNEIVELYREILRVVNSMGYSDPLDFLKDFFPEKEFRKVRVFRKNINRRIKLERTPTQQPVNTVEKKSQISSTQVSPEEPKKARIQNLKSDMTEKEAVSRPIKIKKEVFDGRVGSGELNVEMSQKDKNKVMKYKRTSKRFKDMDQKEKEADNKFDYFMYRSKLDEKSKMYLDNRQLLNDNPFISNIYNDIDLEFREVMYRIYKHNRSQIKDKSKYAIEMEFLENYFAKKLNISKQEEDSSRKLSNAIAYLMRKLQNKIFEVEDDETVELMLYFKTRLCAFYNYYRK
ncbi:uncharacterized protein VICG_00887 [Vittaforma corneae ATCC 50505]|uniref:Uncharacterized protein n=1 Tax=Vittaforma corneae (strain ATCC 50505) TaxID=993615 RepID=L2GNG8_VITCO|nr:uncharacterized protein VICG_00887 [Vittaforma corneae ATCC 50505]ELA42040.1 hypothetical protein VICG_00887 [Vittaforma corneae ATCC 50505]